MRGTITSWLRRDEVVKELIDIDLVSKMKVKKTTRHFNGRNSSLEIPGNNNGATIANGDRDLGRGLTL